MAVPEQSEAGRPSSEVVGTHARRDEAILDLSLSAVLRESEEAFSRYRAARRRATSVFGTVSGSLAFIVGTTLQRVGSLDGTVLAVGLLLIASFGAATIYVIWPHKIALGVHGQNFRDTFYRGQQPETHPEHVFPLADVKDQLIDDAAHVVKKTEERLAKTGIGSIASLILATVTLSYWIAVLSSID